MIPPESCAPTATAANNSIATALAAVSIHRFSGRNLRFEHPAYLSRAAAKRKDGVLWTLGAQLLNGTSARSRGSRRYRPSQVSTPKVIAKHELKTGWPARTSVHTAPPR